MTLETGRSVTYLLSSHEIVRELWFVSWSLAVVQRASLVLAVAGRWLRVAGAVESLESVGRLSSQHDARSCWDISPAISAGWCPVSVVCCCCWRWGCELLPCSDARLPQLVTSVVASSVTFTPSHTHHHHHHYHHKCLLATPAGIDIRPIRWFFHTKLYSP